MDMICIFQWSSNAILFYCNSKFDTAECVISDFITVYKTVF